MDNNVEGFCGFLGKKEKVLEDEQLKGILDAFSSNSESQKHIFTFQYFSLGISVRKEHTKPRIVETSRYFLFASGRFDNKEFIDLFTMKGFVFDELFSKKFNTVLSDVRGDFVLILYDKKFNKLVCVRDQIGVRPLYYLEQERFFCFASEIKAFRRIPNFTFIMDDQWIADSLSLIKSEKYRTPYEGIRNLTPGNILEFDREVNCIPYWNPGSENVSEDLSFESAVQIFSEKLDQAVKRRIIGCRAVGSELSGGLDSSGVTAYAFQNIDLDKQFFYALSHSLDGENALSRFPYEDESKFSIALTKALGISNHILCSGTELGILNSLKSSLIVQSGPSQQGFHFYSDLLLQNANQNGVDRLLSGFGGDEGVSSKAAGFFNELRITGKKALFREELLKSYERNGMARIPAQLKAELRYYLTPAKDLLHLQRMKRRQLDAGSVLNAIDTGFLDSMNIRNRFKMKYVFPDEATVQARQLRRVKYDYISQRLEYSYLAGRAYGIDYAYPLWDVDLLQFYLSLPAEFKFRNGIGRALFREALRDVVPDQIRLRDDKSGYTIPAVFSRVLNDHDRIKQLILDCRDNNRYHFLNYNYMLFWLNSIKMKTLGTGKRSVRPGAFINAVQILLLQNMERSGEFQSGIKV